MRNVVCLMLGILLITGFTCGCGEEKTNQPHNDSDNTGKQGSQVQKNVEQPEEVFEYADEEPEPTYYHSAIRGAVIVNQDGSPRFSYSKKCESCGEVENNTNNTYATGGTLHGGYFCTYCKTNGQFEIKTTENRY